MRAKNRELPSKGIWLVQRVPTGPWLVNCVAGQTATTGHVLVGWLTSVVLTITNAILVLYALVVNPAISAWEGAHTHPNVTRMLGGAARRVSEVNRIAMMVFMVRLRLYRL